MAASIAQARPRFSRSAAQMPILAAMKRRGAQVTAPVAGAMNDPASVAGDAPASDAVLEEVRRLGEALSERVDDVLERTVARSRNAGPELDDATRESFARIGRSSTAAVAMWMAGGSPEAGRETGRKAFETYGQLAAQRVTPLNEVTKRCLRWRDAVCEMLCECAQRLEVSRAGLAAAQAMVQRTLDVT